MKLTYVGAHDAVDVPLYGPVQGVIHAVRNGDPVDFPDELGRRLLEQPSNWIDAGHRATVADLHVRLDGLGVEIPEGAKKSDLQELLDNPPAPPPTPEPAAAAEKE